MRVTGDDRPLDALIADHYADAAPACVGVAVSGGGDSTALLHLLHRWARENHVDLRAVTVDHGLRDGSAEEAAAVAAACADLGVAHDTLPWRPDEATGNLQDRARAARYRLLARWAADRKVDRVALGHTQNDVAETFLMRLAREAGVDGLSAMRPRFHRHGVLFDRPLLPVSRSRLRAYLGASGIGWIDDPSNEDRGFERVRARDVLEALAPLGIGAATLATIAGQMGEARAALVTQAAIAARELAHVEAGDVILDAAGFARQPAEIRRRLLAAATRLVAPARFGPRRDALAGLQARLDAGETTTLGGCLWSVGEGKLRATREWQAVRDMVSAPGEPWDGRWHLVGPAFPGARIAALGEDGLAACPDWRATGLPRPTLMATPGVWKGDQLIAAPLAGLPAGWEARLAAECRDLATFLLSD